MTNFVFTRRRAIHGLALATSTALIPCGALAAAASSERILATAALFRAMFPHKRLTQGFYIDMAKRYLNEIAGDKSALAAHVAGLARLDGSFIAPFDQLPPAIQHALVEQVDQEPFFKAMLRRGAELLYRDTTVCSLIGYEGSSVEYGGYIDRGFNDIDWLPGSAGGKA